jgi:excisionase family DNA binding protein
MDKLLASIPEACQAIGCGRSYAYELIRDGKIEAVKSGKRRLIVVSSLRAYVESLRTGGSHAAA